MSEIFHVRGSLCNDSEITQKFRIILNIIYLAKNSDIFAWEKLKETIILSPVIMLKIV